MASGWTARKIIELILRKLGSGGTRAVGAANALLGSTAQGATDSEYPTEFAPGSHHVYNVVYAPRPDNEEEPYQNMNYLGKRDAATIAEAAEQQSVAEHNEALMKYVKMLPKGATPRQIQAAMDRGREEEKNLPKWWNESNNRREFSVSSSAVKGIRITPEGSVQVQWGKSPKWYTFRNYSNTMLASKAARELLESDSIGRAVYPVVSHPPKKPNPLLGQWNRKNYEAGYAV